MRIYFTASLRGKKAFEENYLKLVEALEGTDYKVYSQHILNTQSEAVERQEKKDAEDVYSRLISEIKKSDIFVAEVSTQSLSVGHEITEAMALNKPVVLFYVGSNKPGLLFGANYDKLQMVQYSMSDIKQKVRDAIERAKSYADVRFNFFVSPKILNYLDWVAQKRMIPRSVFLRNLIEREMKKDKEYKGE